MGSEMCIRDRDTTIRSPPSTPDTRDAMCRLARGPPAQREASFLLWPTARTNTTREDDILGRCAAGRRGEWRKAGGDWTSRRGPTGQQFPRPYTTPRRPSADDPVTTHIAPQCLNSATTEHSQSPTPAIEVRRVCMRHLVAHTAHTRNVGSTSSGTSLVPGSTGAVVVVVEALWSSLERVLSSSGEK